MGTGSGEGWGCVRKVTVMSYTHKLRGIFAKVGFDMSLVGGTEELKISDKVWIRLDNSKLRVLVEELGV